MVMVDLFYHWYKHVYASTAKRMKTFMWQSFKLKTFKKNDQKIPAFAKEHVEIQEKHFFYCFSWRVEFLAYFFVYPKVCFFSNNVPEGELGINSFLRIQRLIFQFLSGKWDLSDYLYLNVLLDEYEKNIEINSGGRIKGHSEPNETNWLKTLKSYMKNVIKLNTVNIKTDVDGGFAYGNTFAEENYSIFP